MQENFDIFFKKNRNDDIFAIIVAFLLALLLHVIAYNLLPSTFVKKIEKPSQMALEILPPEIKKQTPKFVEANPYGNELKPEKSAPVSFKTQRASDEVPDKLSKSSRPFVKGEDKKYKKIVSGTNDKLDKIDPSRITKIVERPLNEYIRSEQTAQAKQESIQQKQAQQTSLQKQLQTTNKLKSPSKTTAKALQPDKIDSANITKDANTIIVPKIKVQESKKTISTNAKPLQNVQQKTSEQTIAQTQQAQQPQQKQELPAPRARPRLSMKIPAGPLMDNNTAASNTGRISIDSCFSEFGAYQQRMIEAISRQWNLLGSRYDLSLAVGSQVVINFSLNTEGELVAFKIVFSTSTHTGAGLCEQAILSTAPYGVWTQEMVNTLGQQPQQVTIRFLYR